tara:strand:+ start:507 stop:935 length:429 start_codon:yes stop_codon:yes gene_type:complete
LSAVLKTNKNKTGWGKATAFALAIMLVLLNAFVPQGFMPEKAEDGSLTFVICSGDGTREITLSADGTPQNPQDEQDQDNRNEGGKDSCPFIALQNPALLTSPEPTIFDTTLTDRHALNAYTAVFHSRNHSQSLSRAPPSSIV